MSTSDRAMAIAVAKSAAEALHVDPERSGTARLAIALIGRGSRAVCLGSGKFGRAARAESGCRTARCRPIVKSTLTTSLTSGVR